MTGSVLIAVPSYQRPASLARLLEALTPQARAAHADVLVIDNDPARSAEDVARASDVGYTVETARGLAAVRNRALDEAGAYDAVVFIDDDEIPTEGWLPALLGRWADTGADAVSGRVESVFPGAPDPWIAAGGFFTRVAFRDGQLQAAAATNNLLLDMRAVRRLGLRFDEAFGLSGGEDIFFTTQLSRAGGRIVSCPGALVHDIVDPDRLTRRWVLRRAYRVGLTTAAVDIRLNGTRARARAVAKGAVRVVAGSGRRLLGVLVRSPRHSARGARAVWRGAGMLAGATGRTYDEYARRSTRG